MAKLDNIRRITVEDFKEEDRDTVAKLAEVLNLFMEQVTTQVNGKLGYDNLDREFKTMQVTVSSTGKPVTQTRFSAPNGAKGLLVMRAVNQTNSVLYPLSNPLISFSPVGNGLYQVTNITGLQPNNKYLLTFEVIY